ncbi:MAG: hypothetical protein V4451_04690 [Pseudomonadota bacterium]
MDKTNIPFFTAVEPVEFSWPISLPVPGDGKYSYVEVTGVFKWMPKADAEALTKEPDPVTGQRRTDLEIAQRVLLRIVGMKYADDTEVPSSPELVAAFLGSNNAPIVTIGTWMGALQGLAREKNS